MRTTESILAGLLALAAIPPPPAQAAPITINGITASDFNLFARNTGVNDIGVGSGFFLQFGADIVGGSKGYSGAGIFTAAGATAPTLVQSLSPCNPFTVDPDFCARATSFTTAKLNGTWAFEIESPTGTTAIFPLPSAAPIPTTPVPFPQSVTITNSASGVNPTISWTLPGSAGPGGPSYTPDAVGIQIFDRSTPPLPNGENDVIHSAGISPTATSYTLPTTLSSGKKLVIGDKYTIDFLLVTTRSGGGDLTRSASFFDFTPQLGSTTPTNINLPMVDTTGVYHFDVGSVGPSSVTYIDPAIAVGYKYATGAGDPNFASVLLPDVGGGVFDLSYDATEVSLDAGIQYFFPTGGVDDFTVTGIDPAAELDPADTSAFVTGLTFVKDGSFTGTMTPLTKEVPEPASLALLAPGLLGLLASRRGRRAHAG